MTAELPPFKNMEHNFESASTIDSDTTPLKTVNEYRLFSTAGTLEVANSEAPTGRDAYQYTRHMGCPKTPPP